MTDSFSTEDILKMIENIRSADINARLNSLSNLKAISVVLGEERTENELIPYTMETVDHTDECLIKIAKGLRKISEKFKNKKLIILSLKTLCEKEDQDIRSQGVKSILYVGKVIFSSTEKSETTEKDKKMFLNFIYELCEDTWYTLRCSGSSLLCYFYRKFPKSDFKKVNGFLLNLSTDKNVIVRKTIAQSYSILLKSLENSTSSMSSTTSHSIFDVSQKILKNFANDTNAAVLIEIPQSIAIFANSKILTNPSNLEYNMNFSIDLMKTIMKSKIWQAKSVLISLLDQIFLIKDDSGKNESRSSPHKAITRTQSTRSPSKSKDLTNDSANSITVFPRKTKSFIKYVATESSQDTNDTIRSSIARQISFIFYSRCFFEDSSNSVSSYAIIDEDGIEEFKDFATTLIADTQADVRSLSAESLGKIRPAPNVPNFIDHALGALLNDPEVTVRISALKSAAATGYALDLLTSSAFLEELVTNTTAWRVRKSISETIPKIASTLSDVEFNEQLIGVTRLLLKDDADDVRKEMIKSIVPLARKYGTKWLAEAIVPLLKEMYRSDDYMIRKAAVSAVLRLKLKNACAEVLQGAVKDPVPNVRMVLARELPRTSSLLQKMIKDDDPDVAYYAALTKDVE